MSRRQPADEGLLFDLPLERESARRPVATPSEPAAEEAAEQPPLPLQDEPAAELIGTEAAVKHAQPSREELPAEPSRWQRRESPRTSLRLRLAAGLTDLGVCFAILVLLLVALLAQGIRPAPADWPAGMVFLLSFSFLYTVMPLAFWGRTPGMALAGLKSTSPDGNPVTFRQAASKWLGSVLTVALAGLPVLLALGGRRSLSDLMGGAVTRRTGPPG